MAQNFALSSLSQFVMMTLHRNLMAQVTIRVAAEMAKDLTKSIFDKFIRRKTQFRLKLIVDSEKSLLARKLEKERLNRKIQLHSLRKEVVNEIKNVELIRMKEKFNDKFTKNLIKSTLKAIIDAENLARSQELYRKNLISKKAAEQQLKLKKD